ncbi:unnamed protein product [Rhodiola kirilowii]
MNICNTASISTRVQDDPESEISPSPSLIESRGPSILNCAVASNTSRKNKLFRVFSEDFETVKNKILDPRGYLVNQWNKIFLVACLISLFLDPLFLYLPVVKGGLCITMTRPLDKGLTSVRSLFDVFYIFNIFVRFRTAYVAPSSRALGRGDLVIDPQKIALRYVKRGFCFDFLAALPVPQVLIQIVIGNLSSMEVIRIECVLRGLIVVQYSLRLYLTFPLSSQIIKTTGVVMKRAWAGAAYNLMLYVLASHVIGACWYLLAVDRQDVCWRRACLLYPSNCNFAYFSCESSLHASGISWLKSSNISALCNAENDFFQFGIYGDLITFGVGSSSWVDKYFYCLWWGLKNLSCLGQNLITSTYVEENVFSIIIGTIGLVLFASLISNLQTYLQSTTVRVEEWRIKMTDTEQWMHHRQLPRNLRQKVRTYGQYRWVTTRGVDEEAILKALPVDLRRDIKRHLCLDLVRRVPLFDQMDDRMLDAICDRLKPELCTPNTYIVREGDPVNAMLFIIRGRLDSWTTNGGQIGFFNCCWIGPSDFCGEELLTWALDPSTGMSLPLSTRTVKAITEVEAFALSAEDLKFVATQFRRLHSKQLRHTFRFHSHQWRTWAACFIQAAWFRYKRKKESAELKTLEAKSVSLISHPVALNRNFSTTNLAASYSTRMSASTRSVSCRPVGTEFEILGALLKPADPDFTVEK